MFIGKSVLIGISDTLKIKMSFNKYKKLTVFMLFVH